MVWFVRSVQLVSIISLSLTMPYVGLAVGVMCGVQWINEDAEDELLDAGIDADEL